MSMVENGGNGLDMRLLDVNGITPEAFQAEFRRTPEAERSQRFCEDVCESLALAHKLYDDQRRTAPGGLTKSAIIFIDIEAQQKAQKAQNAPQAPQQGIPLL